MSQKNKKNKLVYIAFMLSELFIMTAIALFACYCVYNNFIK